MPQATQSPDFIDNKTYIITRVIVTTFIGKHNLQYYVTITNPGESNSYSTL